MLCGKSRLKPYLWKMRVEMREERLQRRTVRQSAIAQRANLAKMHKVKT